MIIAPLTHKRLMEAGWKQKTDEELVFIWQDEASKPQLSSPIAAELLQRYHIKVYRWCARFIYDQDRALDMTQDVLMSAFENLHSVPKGARFAAWLFVIARNTCLGELRKMKVRQTDNFALEHLADGGNNPEEELFQRLEEEAFLRLLDTELKPEEKKAICLRCFEKMPVDTVTAVLGLEKASGARGLLQNARRKLKRAMTRDGFGKKWNRKGP